jgi:YtxH-like protein
MKLRKENILANVLMGTGLYILDSMRDRLSDSMSDLRQRARDTYDTASERVSRASDVLTGEDHPGLSTAAAVLIGIGLGVGIGLLFAPASGEETRRKIQNRFSQENEPATGTYGA